MRWENAPQGEQLGFGPIRVEMLQQPQELVFTMQSSGAPCGDPFLPEEEAFIDNVRVTTDAACPSE